MTDYLEYEKGYKQGATDMENAKQIIIDNLLEQIKNLEKQIISRPIELLQERLEKIKKLKIEEPNNPYNDWDKSIEKLEHRIEIEEARADERNHIVEILFGIDRQVAELIKEILDKEQK